MISGTRSLARWLALAATAAVVLAAVTAGPALAQADRYEVGLRVRAMEDAWDASKDPEAKTRASAHLKKAVSAFFSVRFGEVGKALASARRELETKPDTPPLPEGARWAEALTLRLDRRLLDTRDGELSATLALFYRPEAPPPPDARVRAQLRLGDAAGGRAKAVLDTPIPGPLENNSQALILRVGGTPEGDHALRVSISSGETTLASHDQTVSFVDRLPERLAALSRAIEGFPEETGQPSTDRETDRSLLSLLRGFEEGKTLETDYPIARLFAEAEAIVEAAARGKPFHGKNRPGEFWMTLGLASGKRASIRLLAPPAVTGGQPLPVVLALHGAGGTENLFFDGYGHGAIVRLCRERGWILVAPRSSLGSAPLSEILDELARLYPIDRARVALVGHSMGAMQALGAASQSPRTYAAVAALGGGRPLKPAPGFDRLPVFVGIGTDDFAYPGAKALGANLKELGLKGAVYREYPGIEHLAIVQVALPDVFVFPDRAIGAPNP